MDHLVSISALSDHFGHRTTNKLSLDCGPCFNIRSIGSLWSSSPVAHLENTASCFNIRSIGSLWSSMETKWRRWLLLSFNIRSIGSLWSSDNYTLLPDSGLEFQYPLYRITLVIAAHIWVTLHIGHVSISALSDHFGHLAPLCRPPPRPLVSISALSDHFGHPSGQAMTVNNWIVFQYPLYRITLVIMPRMTTSQTRQHCFNIRSIGSLWSSLNRTCRQRQPTMFQYPLYRITLVINLFSARYRLVINVSISALSDHFGHR